MIQIISAPRASAPYPWAKFWRWLTDQGIDPQEIQTMVENGVEPTITNAVGFALDESVSYQGLPDPDHLPDDINGIAPSFTLLGGLP